MTAEDCAAARAALASARPASPAQPPAELPEPEQVDGEAQQYALDAAGYDVSVRDAWRDGYAAAEERWNAAANESARLDVLDNTRLRAELADCRAAGDALADAAANLIAECARRTVAHQAVHTRDLTGWPPLEREVKAWRSGR